MSKLVDLVVPMEQEGTTAVVKNWLKKLGDTVRADEPVVEIETDKVAVEVAAPVTGVLAEIVLGPETEVQPGAVLARINTIAEVDAETALVQAKPAPSLAQLEPVEQSGRLAPGIRKLLADHGLREDDVPYRGSKLTRDDIIAEAERRKTLPAGVKRVPHDSMRKRIAEHLSHSVRTAPHVTAVFEADFTAIANHRNSHKDTFRARGANLTYTAYFVSAAARAMQAAPAVNARWFDQHIDIFEDVNVGIGTALGDKGLIVPVIHAAQKKDLFAIASALTELTEKARGGKLSHGDVQGGTFSISNHGVSGSLVATPIIINQPQSAILGIGKLEKRAVVRERDGADRIEVRPMAYVSLTIDHRVVDAHQTNAWLTRFVELLENWPLEKF